MVSSIKLRHTFAIQIIFALAVFGAILINLSQKDSWIRPSTREKRTFDIPVYAVRGPLPWNALNEVPLSESFMKI